MTIGAHTLTHPMLSQAPSELAYMEIAESRARLQDVLKKPVWAFAYPFGDPQSVTSQVLTMPKQAGFTAAFLNCGGGLGTASAGFCCATLACDFKHEPQRIRSSRLGFLRVVAEGISSESAEPSGLVEA